MSIFLNLEGISTPVPGTVFTAFDFEVWNNGGTLQHRILGPNTNAGLTSSIFASLINGATHSFVDTPTGADASTPFAAGAKVSSSVTHLVFFDTPDQPFNEAVFLPVLKQTNNGSAAVNVEGVLYQASVNGDIRRRLTLAFYNAGTGAGLPINTTTLAAGRFIRVAVFAYLKP